MRLPAPRRLGLGLLVALLAAQLIRPARTNPAIDPSRTLQATTSVPAEVAAIIDRSCKDCHTSATEWPWYSQIAPMSWMVVAHVSDGRRHINFSDWAAYSPADADKHLAEICEEVRDGAMPLASYVLVHKSAALEDADRQALCTWTERARARVGTP